MSKILKNTTGSNINIVDTGITLLASPATYTIPPQDYLIWAASSNIITYIGNGNVIVNDGSTDLSISDGTDLIKHIFPKRMGVLSGDDLTQIGHVNDRLKVDSAFTPGSGVSHINRVDVNATLTASGNSATLDAEGYGSLTFDLTVTAVSGTNPKMQIRWEVSDDNIQWTEALNTERFTAAGDTRFNRLATGSKYYRYAWTISGTSPSFNVVMITTLKNYLPLRHTVINDYELFSLTTVGNTSKTFRNLDCANVSISVTRDAGSGNVNYKIQGSNNGSAWFDFSGNIGLQPSSVYLTQLSGISIRFLRLILVSGTDTGTADVFWSAGGG